MKGRPSDKERLKHMIESIDRIKKFTDKMNFEEFLDNEMAQFAIIKNFEIIGEAAYYASKELKDKYSKIEWRKIEALRHKLVHDYYEINLEIVWKSKEDKLGKLKEQIGEILKTIEEEE